MNTTRKYLALDLETAKITDDASDWKLHRPLGISCAATLMNDELRLWHGGDRANPNDRMSQQEAAALVHYLEDRTKDGYTLLTWNGLGFDFDILAEESQMLSQCRALAIAHVDMMWHVFCQLGHGVGLDAAARGMGLEGKLEGMCGEMAPVLWARGEREKVLCYVGQDVRTTLEVALKCVRCRELRWVARSGRLRTMALPEGGCQCRKPLDCRCRTRHG